MKIALALVAASLGACTGALGGGDDVRLGERRYFGGRGEPRGQVLRMNLGAEPELRDPGLLSGHADGQLARMLFEGLTVPDGATLEPQPGQAERWQRSDDGLTYTFYLRPDLRWSDGAPLRAGDFAYAWRRALSPTTPSRNASLLFPIRGAEELRAGRVAPGALAVRTPDDRTLVVTLRAPSPHFLALTSHPVYAPVPEHVVARHGERWTALPHLVGNGPFVCASWRQHDHYELVRSPTYWGRDRVRLQRVLAYTIDDLSASLNLYRSGALDWSPSGLVPPAYAPYLRRYADYRAAPYQGTYFYSLNVTRGPLRDPRVRRALGLSIDRDAIARDLLRDSVLPWGRITPRSAPGYPAPAPMRFAPDQARAELAAAGYPGGRGLPTLTVLINAGDDHRRIAEAIWAMWRRELGVTVELVTKDWSAYLHATAALDYDVARRSWVADYPDPSSFLQILASGDGNNRTGWTEPRYDELLRAAAAAPDDDARHQRLARAEELALEQAVILPIYHYATTELVQPWVRGLSPNPLDVHPLREVWIDHAWRSADEAAR